ncbi:MAG: hypothetical protein FWC43_12960, partial [Planctomycetaceae bacterium]|nr:hypothetical protein [Planctomycetaceae bacterium]
EFVGILTCAGRRLHSATFAQAGSLRSQGLCNPPVVAVHNTKIRSRLQKNGFHGRFTEGFFGCPQPCSLFSLKFHAKPVSSDPAHVSI